MVRRSATAVPRAPSDTAGRATLRAAGLLTPAADDAFAGLVALAARVAGAPTAFLTLVDGDRQVVKGAHGAPPALAGVHESPLDASLCRLVVEANAAVTIEHARTDPRARHVPAVRDLGVAAYAGVPVRARDGRVLGTLCVVDYTQRAWRPDEIDALAPLAAAVATEIELQCERAARYRELVALSPTPMIVVDEERFLAVNDAYVRLVGARDAGELLGRSPFETVGLVGGAARRARERVRAVVRDGVPAPVRRFEFRRLDGQTVAVESTIAPTTIDGRPAALIALRDLTETRRAREALRASEARFRHLVEAAHEGVCTTDAVGIVTYANPRLVDMLRVPADAVVGRALFEFMGPDDAFEARTLFARRQRGIAESHELTFRRGDGAELHGIVSASPLHDDDGAFAGMLALVTDVTERRRAEAALRDSETRFRQLFERNPLPLWVFDAETLRFLDANPAAVAQYGWSLDELRTMTLYDVRPPDERAELRRHLARRPDDARRTLRVRHRTRDGGVRIVDVTSDAIDLRGRPARIAVLNDVTERVAAEAARAESEERFETSERYFRALIEHASELITVLDEEGRIVYANDAYAGILGYTPEEAIALHASDLVHPEDLAGVRERFAEALESPGGTVRVECRARHRDGSWRRLQSFARNMMHEPAVRGVIVNSRDVTDERALADQMRQAQKMEAVGQLAGGIAHDFNNLLTVINASITFARDALDADSPAREDLVAIDEAARRAGALTRQLLAFSRQQVLRPRALHLGDVVADVTRMLERVIGADVRLETALAPDLPTVHADASQLEQVLMNLAVNARDAMPHGGTLAIETTLLRFDAEGAARYLGLAPGAYVALRVRDTGVGMDAATQARAFEPFFTTKEVGRGTGLGLSTVYGIVKQSGGYVYVDSAPGEGSTFTVLLPPGDAAAEPAAPSRERSAAGGRETVLVVEDETPLRVVLARALRRAGYTVLEAGDGAAALALVDAAARAPDLVVSDAVMPGMRGAELVDRLRERYPGLPALLISGYSRDAIAPADPPGVALLGKPFSPRELLARVRSVLDAAAPRDGD